MIRFRERASLCCTSLDLAVLAALQGCHFMITISGLSVALQLLDQAVLAALQGCHFIITISGPSVALQLLVTLSPSLRPALEVVLEVDTYDDSRGRGRHVRRISR